MDLSTQIHIALEQAGLPVLGVSDQDSTKEGIVVRLTNPTPKQQAEANAIIDSFF